MRCGVAFETYKLKHPNTGLFHFTKELALALDDCAKSSGDCQMTFFTQRKYRHILGGKLRFADIRWWSSLLVWPMPGIKVWHSPYQISKFMPSWRCKVVVTVHDLNFMYEKSEKKRKRYLAKLQKNMDRADAVVAISEFTKQDLCRYVDMKGKAVEVIYNGCNIYDGKAIAPTIVPEKPFLFGVGTILPKKNWHVLPVLLQDNDYLLYIAGKPSAYSQRIIDEAERLGVADRVRLVGEVSEAEKHWYLANCKAFLFPSVAEGFGLPVIEAMYYGKPVFISKHTSLPEVGGDHAYYFNYDFDPELMRSEFKRGMEDFELNGDPLKESKYAQSFSWKRAAESYILLYKSLSSK